MAGRRAAGPDDPVAFERATRAELIGRRWLRLHVTLIAALTTALCWGVSAALRAAGLESLLWRPVLAVTLTWPLYLGLLWLWSRWLIARDEPSDASSLLDLTDPADLTDLALDAARAAARGLSRPGGPVPGGGSFGGGGAQAGFNPVPMDSGGVLGDALGEAGGKALSGVVDAVGDTVGDADEAAAVVVPLIVVVGVALALAAALGFVVFGLFGVDVLLGAAVELAFASVGGALAWRARREGWLPHVLRRTAVPMLGVVVAVAVAGALLQTWVPQAATWPQALRMLLASTGP